MSKSTAGVFTFSIIFIFTLWVNAWAKADISPGESIKYEVPVMAALEIPDAPIPMKADNKVNLLYEMHISNLGNMPLFLKKISVAVDGAHSKTLAQYSGKAFDDMLSGFGPQPSGSDMREIKPGMRVVAFIWVTLKDTLPDKLHHRIVFKNSKSEESPMYLDGPIVTVNKRNVPEILSPVLGDRWLAAEGPVNIKEYSHHRFGIITMGGKPHVPQRYAIDWMKLGPDGKLFKGDPKRNDSWYCYGQEIRTVAHGVVKEMKDGIPENVPLEIKRIVPMTLDTVCGNYVLVDCGNDTFALYAHIIPGTIRVKVGDRIKAGQVLGLLGNSGNSDAPHLHFQLDTTPAGHVLASEGLPYTISSFIYQGRIPVPFPHELLKNIKNIGDLTWRPEAGIEAMERNNEIPLGYRIYKFTR